MPFKALISTPLRIILTAFCFAQFAVQIIWLSKWAMPRLLKGNQNVESKRNQALKTAQKHVKFYLRTLSAFRLVAFQFIGKPMHSSGLISSNHPSILDFIVLLVDFPTAVCIYKSQANANPVLSEFVHISGYVEGMDGTPESSKRIIQDCNDKIISGHQIIVFPEGTRSKTALTPHRFRNTLFHSAIQTQAPVQPIAIYCRPLFLGKNQSWFEFSTAENKMVISYLKPISMHDLPEKEQTAQGLAAATRKAIEVELQRLDAQP